MHKNPQNHGTNNPIHIQKVMNILAMYGFTTITSELCNSTMTSKIYRIYFYNNIIHKMYIDKSRINVKGRNIFDIDEYKYLDKDILRLIEDIQ